MKKWIVLFVLLVFLLALSACTTQQPVQEENTAKAEETPKEESIKGEYKKITAEQGKKLIDENKDAIILDVRIQEEYNDIRIPFAILIPDEEIKSMAQEELPNKDALIIVYCRSGRRSALAAKDLAEMGYTNVYDMGGIIDWEYETE